MYNRQEPMNQRTNTDYPTQNLSNAEVRLAGGIDTCTGLFRLTIRVNENGLGWCSPLLRYGLRKVRSLSVHPWMTDSDKPTGQSMPAGRKGADKNCILTFSPDLMRQGEQNECPLRN